MISCFRQVLFGVRERESVRGERDDTKPVVEANECDSEPRGLRQRLSGRLEQVRLLFEPEQRLLGVGRSENG